MTTGTELFLITGATGKTGAHTVRLLWEGGHRVRAFVRTLDERSARLAEQGAEVLAGDLLDFRAVSSAVTGVTAAYFCYPIDPGLLDATAIFAQAASEAGVRAVVNMSQISARREAKSNAACLAPKNSTTTKSPLKSNTHLAFRCGMSPSTSPPFPPG
jgi:uncharacterized protein YbjT (DUF2867 family)